MKRFLILFLVLASGCISPEVRTGSPAEYELPGLENTTIFYLNVTEVQVVESVINESSTRVFTGNYENFWAPVAVDYSMNNVSFNVSEEFIFGKSYARFDFGMPFSGYIAFTQSAGQDFTYPLTENGSIKVVLPVNYTSASFLGIAQPKPDNITRDAKGREVISWENPYPEMAIRVKYSYENAPTLLFYFLFSLFFFAVLVAGYYYTSLRALKKKRAMMEKDVRKY